MALFRRNKNNQTDYLQTPSTTSRPMAILSALFTGLLVAAAVVAIYFGGKWLYDRFNSSKNDTPSANVENNDQSTNNTQDGDGSGNPSGSDSGNQNNTSSGSSTGSNGSTSTNNNGSSGDSGTSGSSNNQSSGSSNSNSTPLTSTGAAPEAEVIPNTGPDPNYNY